jgi:DNA polymerase delta subunit 3
MQLLVSELAAFHVKASNSSDQMCCATYIVSGRVHDSRNGKPKESQSSSDIDIDMGYGFTPTPTPNYGLANGSDQYGGEAVLQVRMTVVGEDKLEGMGIC